MLYSIALVFKDQYFNINIHDKMKRSMKETDILNVKTFDYRDWESPASKSRCDWKIVKAT